MDYDMRHLANLGIIAEAYNRVLRNLVDEAAKIVPYDLASDFIYGVRTLDNIKVELQNEKDTINAG